MSTLFLLLSLLGIATALPLAQDGIQESVVARGSWVDPPEPPRITIEAYEAYLKKYFPNTDRYIFYTGNSLKQVKAFQAKNPGYLMFDDMFNTHGDRSHPWYDLWHESTHMDDGDAASEAMSRQATKKILVFGGAEYMTEGKKGFYYTKEADNNKAGVREGRIESINHMARNALSPDQVMIKEDGDGKMHWQTGYKEGTTNASGVTGDGEPRIASKESSRSSSPVPAGSCKKARM